MIQKNDNRNEIVRMKNKKRQIINIINFVRANEPRTVKDLFEPVREQINLLKKYHLKGTFLLQYDAIVDPVFFELFKSLPKDQIELGVWLEIVQPLVEKAGIEWRGRALWDWHAHCGFSVGYTLDERKRLIDIVMSEFKSKFGYYPKSLGSWAIDAYTLAYASEKYGLDASCNCKEQWGTDGYTLWGGYYGQGYYPSKSNMLCPAQSRENQIHTPVFRMLGSDPVFQYDCGLDLEKGATDFQHVITLEPSYNGAEGGGGVPQWVDWYLKENFNANCLSFGYTQVGQENSFGWRMMKDGLIYQFEEIAKLKENGLVEIETLGETGRWFKNTYSHTPASVIFAENDWKNDNHTSLWYCCKNYRINVFSEKNRFWIRDMYLFDEKYEERYFKQKCTGESLQFDNLPVIDGNRWSGNGIRAGIYPMMGNNGVTQPFSYQQVHYYEENSDAILQFDGTYFGKLTLRLSPKSVLINAEKQGEKLVFVPIASREQVNKNVSFRFSKNEISMKYNGFSYRLTLLQGYFDEKMQIHTTKNSIEIARDIEEK